MRHRAWFLPVVGASVLLTSLALAACGSATSARFHSGTYRVAGDGFTTSALSSTLVGYAGHDRAVLLAVSAIGSFGDGVHATVNMTAGRLVVGVGSYTLTCHRRGPQADAPTPAGTGG